MRETKDSGIEWIGNIPINWEVCKIKSIADSQIENSFIDGDWIESSAIEDAGIRYYTTGNVGDGVFKRQGNGYISEKTFIGLNCKYAFPGDLVISRLNEPYGRSCILPDDEDRYVLAVDIVILRPSAEYNKKYICYLSQTLGYQNAVKDKARGTAMKRISRNNLGNIFLIHPPREEQDTIVSFLDHECSKVDALITNQEAQIEKLKVYKQSLITEVVTKGLDPNASIKDSGVEWIGEICSKYDVAPIRSLFKVKKDIIGKEPETVLSITQNGLRIKDITENSGQMAESYANYQIVNIGDFAMNHMDLLTGGVGISEFEGVTSPDYRVFVLRNREMNPRYFLYVFQMYYRNRIFYAFGQGAANIGRWRLPAQNFNTIAIPVPPIEDQNAIVEYLDQKIATIDKLMSIKQTKIEKLNQYKKSLIYEYVTGKKEVM